MFGFGKKQPGDGKSLTQPIPAGWQIADLGLLGAGGMSRVYRVRDESLGREVAFKVLRPELLEENEAIDRFVDEARITAQLDHPNIPPVYALAADRKRSTCFTMKVLEGQSLQQMLEENEREGVDGLFASLDVLVRVCDAVSFAHSKGVLHLDLKPSNVMVGEFGQIYLVDWGLARRKAELPTKETDDGTMNGTPAYMAPEQAKGHNWDIDERTDIFALGGILYRILAGKPPYLEMSADETREAAARAELTPPDQVHRREGTTMPRRLVAISMHALQPNKDQRFQEVGAFKQELEEFIRGMAQLPRKTFAAGEAIVREGEEGDAAYVIFEGHCQATRVVAGKTQSLRLLGPGEMFGETAVFTGAPRSATVTAIMDTVVGVVDQLYLREEMERTSFMSLAIRTVASSFLDLNAQTAAMTEAKRLDKVVDLTLRHLALLGTNGTGGSRKTPWKALLAKLVAETGIPEEDISRRVLKEKGFDVENDQLILRPPNT
ncbi:MAG: protein kinase [Archangium sp.]|nr:protein kinase [Archangium sp.]